MPWKECSVMDERLQFVARRLAGEAMAELCREFGISRKTGYKIFDRYQECGVQGLTDRSRRPYRYAQPTSLSGRELYPEREAGAPQLGCSQNPRTPDAPVLRHSDPCQKHHPCGAGSPWSGRAPRPCSVVALKEPLYRWASAPMNCGAPITRASSCWAIITTATR